MKETWDFWDAAVKATKSNGTETPSPWVTPSGPAEPASLKE